VSTPVRSVLISAEALELVEQRGMARNLAFALQAGAARDGEQVEHRLVEIVVDDYIVE